LANANIKITDLTYPKGSKVIIAVRASNVKLLREGTQAINQMDGKILRRQFIHGFMRYEVEIVPDKIVISELPYKEEFDFNEDDKVIVSFLPEHTLVFPHPGGALEEILEQ
jgi:ABC-type Fe3+/spermidine/putrescine transport system ATPase subunit